MRIRSMLTGPLVFGALFALATAHAAEPIRVVPDRAGLLGPDSVQQLVADRTTGGQVIDITRSSTFSSKRRIISISRRKSHAAGA